MRNQNFYRNHMFIALWALCLVSNHAVAQPLDYSAVKDTLFSKQWGLYNQGQIILRDESELGRERIQGKAGVDINWVMLNDAQAKADKVVVAVIDTGVDVSHPELKGRIWTSDKCKLVDDKEAACEGFDFIGRSAKMVDKSGHGTHVAGIIAANQNGQGIVGVGHPKIMIMPVRVLGPDVNGFTYQLGDKLVYVTDIIADGIEFAVKNGADIINLSIGWPQIVQTPKMKKAIEDAVQKNVIIIAAAGNNNKEVLTYPCTFEGVICVGAVDAQGNHLEFSNFGGKVDILAPGESIVSTYPLTEESTVMRIKGYEAKNGTSQAAPFITAIAASIKLAHPNITVDELKGRLFSTTRAVPNNSQDKFTHAGLVDMKSAIMNAPAHFAAPIFKQIHEINYNPQTREFKFLVPIKNYLSDLADLKIQVQVVNEQQRINLELQKPALTIVKLSNGEVSNVVVQGKLMSGLVDSDFKLKVKLSSGSFSREFLTTLAFSRDLDHDQKVGHAEIQGIDPKFIARFGKLGDKATNLASVVESFYSTGPEYYFLHAEKQTKENTIISFLRLTGDDHSRVNVETIHSEPLPKLETLYEITKVDLNFDGKKDYLAYALINTPKELVSYGKKIYVFILLDHNLKPLYGKQSFWYIPITNFVRVDQNTYELLSFKRNRPEFAWMKLAESPVGSVLVPAIQREWYIPEEDNSLDPMVRLPQYTDKHVYYLNPTTEQSHIVLQLRVLDGFDFIQQLKRKLNTNFSENISLEALFKQGRQDELHGKVSALLSVGKEFNKRYYQVQFDGAKNWQVSPLALNDYTYLAGNTTGPIFSLLDGEQVNNTAFVALYQRNWARMALVDPDLKQHNLLELKTDSWLDPIFTYLAGFTDERGAPLLMVESRQSLYALTDKGHYKLPVNRDSSFPGAQFGEAFLPLVVKNDSEVAYPGIYVDSTLIFGNRLYTMAYTPKGWIRPLDLSVNIPDSCIRLRVAQVGESQQYTYMMLCQKSPERMEFQLYPVELSRD